ncbi:hypothetical protein [Actinoplanes sp. NPDC049265]
MEIGQLLAGSFLVLTHSTAEIHGAIAHKRAARTFAASLEPLGLDGTV